MEEKTCKNCGNAPIIIRCGGCKKNALINWIPIENEVMDEKLENNLI